MLVLQTFFLYEKDQDLDDVQGVWNFINKSVVSLCGCYNASFAGRVGQDIYDGNFPMTPEGVCAVSGVFKPPLAPRSPGVWGRKQL